MERINVTKASRQLSDLLNRVFYQGASFELERGNRVVARLSPPEPSVRGVPIRELNRLFDELPPLGDDAEAFAADLEAIRKAPPAERDPWD